MSQFLKFLAKTAFLFSFLLNLLQSHLVFAAEMCVSRFRLLPSGISVKKLLNGKRLTECCLANYHFAPLLLLLLFFCSVGLCDEFTAPSVPLGFQISAFDRDKIWVSENGVFAFGFLEIDGDSLDEHVVGVKYNLGDKSSNLPVWTIGGGLRVPLNSTFRLTMDGRLILINNLSKITLWSSNTSTLGVEKASLLDNGNLVLLNSKSEVVWESFSSPTNTLLPNQSLHYPQSLRAPSTRSISSYYNLVISNLGELKLVWEHNVTYWRSHFSSKKARFDSNGVFGLYDDLNNVVWSVSSKDYGDSSVTLRHLRIDRDGNLRIYSWDNAGRAWRPVWQAVQDQCNVFGSCGLYSICGYNSTGPVCDCLYSDSLQWGMVGGNAMDSGGSGCKKMVDLGNCKMHASMLVLKQTVLYGFYPPQDVEMLLGEMSCKEFCSNDSSCIAATSMNDGSGRCTIKKTGFVSGYKMPYINAVSFLKVCSVPQAVATHGNGASIPSPNGPLNRGSGKKLVGAIAVIILVTLTVILTVQVLVLWFLYKRRKITVRTRIPFGRKDAPHYSMLARLSFEEIKELTNDFSDSLGDSVFRGLLPNKTPVVAKVLKDVVVLEKEFRATVSTLSGTHHRNLVSLKGFCFEPANKLLIYEYVPNGSLDKWLFENREDHGEQIWQRKLDFALGLARGLAYLHRECQKCITHGNLKLENVLLDENFVPKLTDFGLRDLFVENSASSSSESPCEQDIYMLGEIFLQTVTSKRDVMRENMQQILDFINQESLRIAAGNCLDGIERVVRISFWCMQDQPFLRPPIGEVVKVLEGTLSVDRPPSHLALKHHHSKNSDRKVDSEIVVEGD